MATYPWCENGAGGAYDSGTAAEGWRRGVAARAQALGPLTERMLDLAVVVPGRHVLDVAAGTGEQTLLAARRSGPNGLVLATDIAVSMLAAAAVAAQYPLDAIPEIAKLLAGLSDEDRAAARAEIEAVARRFERPDGVVAPSEYVIGVGAK